METQSPAYSQDEVVIEQEIVRGRQKEVDNESQVSQTVSLSILKKLVLLVKGRVFIGHERILGMRRSLSIYAFRCPYHGIQTDYEHGFYERLDCPLCSYSTWGYPPDKSLA